MSDLPAASNGVTTHFGLVVWGNCDVVGETGGYHSGCCKDCCLMRRDMTPCILVRGHHFYWLPTIPAWVRFIHIDVFLYAQRMRLP